jgi:hypothetical protein
MQLKERVILKMSGFGRKLAFNREMEDLTC